MKIMIVLLLNIFICFNFMGCGIKNAFGELKEEAQYIENKSDAILFCFDNIDAEKLKSMLSKNDQLKFDIDEQIHNAFNYIMANQSPSNILMLEQQEEKITEYGRISIFFLKSETLSQIQRIHTKSYMACI